MRAKGCSVKRGQRSRRQVRPCGKASVGRKLKPNLNPSLNQLCYISTLQKCVPLPRCCSSPLALPCSRSHSTVLMCPCTAPLPRPALVQQAAHLPDDVACRVVAPPLVQPCKQVHVTRLGDGIRVSMECMLHVPHGPSVPTRPSTRRG